METKYSNFCIGEIDGEREKEIEMFEEVLNDKKIENIGVTGPKGIGKSTLINHVVKKKKNKRKSINISLAQFSNNMKKENTEGNFNYKLKMLEKEFLKQLFIASSEISKDKIYRKIITPIILALITFMAIGLLLLFNFSKVIEINILFGSRIDDLEMLLCLLLLISLSVCYIGFKFFKNLIIKEVDYRGIKLQIEKCNEPLSEFLYQVIDIFNDIKVNTVIIEDIDRYEHSLSTVVIEKLRVICKLLNRNKDRKENNIKFIYSLGEEILGFDIESITKFFDVTIPVKPFTTIYNSKDRIKELIGSEPTYSLPEFFLTKISAGIFDTRTIINICNEYKLSVVPDFTAPITKNKINKNKINYFSYVVYKNYYIQDYYKLLRGEGIVFDILEKDLLKKEVIKKLEFQSDEIKNQIEEFFDWNTDLDGQLNEIEEKIIFIENNELSKCFKKYYNLFYLEIKKKLPKKEDELMVMMIKEGFINEYYPKYVSTMTKQEIPQYADNENLTNIDDVIEYLNEISFIPENIKKESSLLFLVLKNLYLDNEYELLDTISFEILNSTKEKKFFFDNILFEYDRDVIIVFLNLKFKNIYTLGVLWLCQIIEKEEINSDRIYYFIQEILEQVGIERMENFNIEKELEKRFIKNMLKFDVHLVNEDSGIDIKSLFDKQKNEDENDSDDLLDEEYEWE